MHSYFCIPSYSCSFSMKVQLLHCHPLPHQQGASFINRVFFLLARHASVKFIHPQRVWAIPIFRRQAFKMSRLASAALRVPLFPCTDFSISYWSCAYQSISSTIVPRRLRLPGPFSWDSICFSSVLSQFWKTLLKPYIIPILKSSQNELSEAIIFTPFSSGTISSPLSFHLLILLINS